jgi:hypothetical protein
MRSAATYAHVSIDKQNGSCQLAERHKHITRQFPAIDETDVFADDK